MKQFADYPLRAARLFSSNVIAHNQGNTIPLLPQIFHRYLIPMLFSTGILFTWFASYM